MLYFIMLVISIPFIVVPLLGAGFAILGGCIILLAIISAKLNNPITRIMIFSIILVVLGCL